MPGARCPAFGWAGPCLFSSVQIEVGHLPTGWPHDHGPTNVGAMVKSSNKSTNFVFFYTQPYQGSVVCTAGVLREGGVGQGKGGGEGG